MTKEKQIESIIKMFSDKQQELNEDEKVAFGTACELDMEVTKNTKVCTNSDFLMWRLCLVMHGLDRDEVENYGMTMHATFMKLCVLLDMDMETLCETYVKVPGFGVLVKFKFMEKIVELSRKSFKSIFGEMFEFLFGED